MENYSQGLLNFFIGVAFLAQQTIKKVNENGAESLHSAYLLEAQMRQNILTDWYSAKTFLILTTIL